jgi:hypothetical protein
MTGAAKAMMTDEPLYDEDGDPAYPCGFSRAKAAYAETVKAWGPGRTYRKKVCRRALPAWKELTPEMQFALGYMWTLGGMTAMEDMEGRPEVER